MVKVFAWSCSDWSVFSNFVARVSGYYPYTCGFYLKNVTLSTSFLLNPLVCVYVFSCMAAAKNNLMLNFLYHITLKDYLAVALFFPRLSFNAFDLTPSHICWMWLAVPRHELTLALKINMQELENMLIDAIVFVISGYSTAPGAFPPQSCGHQEAYRRTNRKRILGADAWGS